MESFLGVLERGIMISRVRRPDYRTVLGVLGYDFINSGSKDAFRVYKDGAS